MPKKGFLRNSKLAGKSLSKDKGKGLAMDSDLNQDKLKTSSPYDMFAYLDPLEIA